MYTEVQTVKTAAPARYMVTMLHRGTGQEQSLMVMPEKESFAAIATAVREKFSYEWEILEWFDPDTPF